MHGPAAEWRAGRSCLASARMRPHATIGPRDNLWHRFVSAAVCKRPQKALEPLRCILLHLTQSHELLRLGFFPCVGLPLKQSA